jgi:hypothetical protein
MKKYLNQTTVNVIAIAGAVAWGLCAISPNNSTRSNNGFSSPEAHAAFDDQIKANKFLDYEIARLKNCGELLQRGIYFSPDSPASWICSDVMID